MQCINKEFKDDLLFVSSKSHSFMAPEEDPATTKVSAESKATDSTGLVWPHKFCTIEVGTKLYVILSQNRRPHALEDMH